ncbi:unnamed protein product [Acanthosepion pharaonis]|uniref:Uncharacterized protein n=1 Tax=Acanthosepion pharaonis TaxID=158019 RepID=A0A812BRQ4_ACAPH|nr:unnamed protein product [Sepia pharaonis]
MLSAPHLRLLSFYPFLSFFLSFFFSFFLSFFLSSSSIIHLTSFRPSFPLPISRFPLTFISYTSSSFSSPTCPSLFLIRFFFSTDCFSYHYFKISVPLTIPLLLPPSCHYSFYTPLPLTILSTLPLLLFHHLSSPHFYFHCDSWLCFPTFFFSSPSLSFSILLLPPTPLPPSTPRFLSLNLIPFFFFILSYPSSKFFLPLAIPSTPTFISLRLLPYIYSHYFFYHSFLSLFFLPTSLLLTLHRSLLLPAIFIAILGCVSPRLRYFSFYFSLFSALCLFSFSLSLFSPRPPFFFSTVPTARFQFSLCLSLFFSSLLFLSFFFSIFLFPPFLSFSLFSSLLLPPPFLIFFLYFSYSISNSKILKFFLFVFLFLLFSYNRFLSFNFPLFSLFLFLSSSLSPPFWLFLPLFSYSISNSKIPLNFSSFNSKIPLNFPFVFSLSFFFFSPLSGFSSLFLIRLATPLNFCSLSFSLSSLLFLFSGFFIFLFDLATARFLLIFPLSTARFLLIFPLCLSLSLFFSSLSPLSGFSSFFFSFFFFFLLFSYSISNSKIPLNFSSLSFSLSFLLFSPLSGFFFLYFLIRLATARFLLIFPLYSSYFFLFVFLSLFSSLLFPPFLAFSSSIFLFDTISNSKIPLNFSSLSFSISFLLFSPLSGFFFLYFLIRLATARFLLIFPLCLSLSLFFSSLSSLFDGFFFCPLFFSFPPVLAFFPLFFLFDTISNSKIPLNFSSLSSFSFKISVLFFFYYTPHPLIFSFLFFLSVLSLMLSLSFIHYYYYYYYFPLLFLIYRP